MAVKKAPAKKVPARKSTAAAPVRKVVAKKTAAKAPARRTAAKPTTEEAPKARRVGVVREKDIHGFVPGTDSANIVSALLEGGIDRKDVNSKAIALITKGSGLQTRGGVDKNVPSLVSGVLSRLMSEGYTIESHYRVVPPEAIAAEVKKQQQAAARKAARASSTAAPVRKVARKVPVKKAAAK